MFILPSVLPTKNKQAKCIISNIKTKQKYFYLSNSFETSNKNYMKKVERNHNVEKYSTHHYIFSKTASFPTKPF